MFNMKKSSRERENALFPFRKRLQRYYIFRCMAFVLILFYFDKHIFLILNRFGYIFH